MSGTAEGVIGGGRKVRAREGLRSGRGKQMVGLQGTLQMMRAQRAASAERRRGQSHRVFLGSERISMPRW